MPSQPSPLPHYDAGRRYDSGLRYADSGLLQTKNRKAKMAKIKMTLSRMNAGELTDQAEMSAGMLAPAAPATPPIPNVATKVTALTTASAAANTASGNYETAKMALVELKEMRDAAVDELRSKHQALISACESEAEGDPVMLAASGYPLSDGTNAPTTEPPAKVLNLALTWSDTDGALDGTHDGAARAKSYEVQVTTGDPMTGTYVTKLQPTATSWKLEDLTSGQRVWVRVRGIGSKGAGPWSDPASRIVP
jgi:hypothetical protein